MKKVLIILLIVGLLVGVCCTAVIGEESLDGDFPGEFVYTIDDPTPCGGGGSSGGGGHPG